MTRDFNRKKLNNPFFRKREVKRYWFKIALIIAFIFIALALWYIVYLSPLFVIKNIISDNYDIKNYLSENNFERNIVKLDKKELADKLIKEFQLEEIEIKKIFPKSLKIDIIERDAYFLLKVNEHLEFRDQNACKIPNQNIRNIDDFPVIINNQLNLSDLPDCLDVNPSTLNETIKLFKLSKQELIEVKYFEIESIHNLNLILSSNTTVYLSLREDLDKQFFKLKQVYLEKINELDEINYIDVRYGDRAFINYK